MKWFWKRLKNSVVSLVIFFGFFLLFPGIIVIYLYGFPQSETQLFAISETNMCNETGVLRVTGVDDGTTRSFLAKLFQTSLGLDWYDICFLNKNELYNKQEKFDRSIDKEAGAMELIVGILGKNTTSSVSIYSQVGDKPRCRVVRYNGEGNLTAKLITYLSRNPSLEYNKHPICVNYRLDTSNSKFYYKNNFFGYLLKFLAICTLWAAFVFGFIKLWQFTNGIRDKIIKSDKK